MATSSDWLACIDATGDLDKLSVVIEKYKYNREQITVISWLRTLDKNAAIEFLTKTNSEHLLLGVNMAEAAKRLRIDDVARIVYFKGRYKLKRKNEVKRLKPKQKNATLAPMSAETCARLIAELIAT